MLQIPAKADKTAFSLYIVEVKLLKGNTAKYLFDKLIIW